MRNYSEKIQNSKNAFEAMEAINKYLFVYFKLEDAYIRKKQGQQSEIFEQKIKFMVGADNIKNRISFLVPTNVWNSRIFKEYRNKTVINLVKNL